MGAEASRDKKYLINKRKKKEPARGGLFAVESPVMMNAPRLRGEWRFGSQKPEKFSTGGVSGGIHSSPNSSRIALISGLHCRYQSTPHSAGVVP